jgi:hypothetical protein
MRFHPKDDKFVRHDVHTEKFNKNSLKFDMSQAHHNMARMADSRAMVPYSPDDSSLALPAIESAKPTTLALKASAATQSVMTNAIDIPKSE